MSLGGRAADLRGRRPSWNNKPTCFGSNFGRNPKKNTALHQGMKGKTTYPKFDTSIHTPKPSTPYPFLLDVHHTTPGRRLRSGLGHRPGLPPCRRQKNASWCLSCSCGLKRFRQCSRLWTEQSKKKRKRSASNDQGIAHRQLLQ